VGENILKLENINAIVFDFDGVLTNNYVQVDQNGNESVSCCRSDGLAFDALRKLKVTTCILSTETNSVVIKRSEKLRVPVINCVDNKANKLIEWSTNNGIDLGKILYVGNDINDLPAMKISGYSACPSDSHQKIKDIATITLRTTGGAGVVRELLEEVFKIDLISVLYPD